MTLNRFFEDDVQFKLIFKNIKENYEEYLDKDLKDIDIIFNFSDQSDKEESGLNIKMSFDKSVLF